MKRPYKKRRRKKVKSKIDKLRRIKFEKLGMDELLGKNLVVPNYSENEEDDIGSIFDNTEVLTKNPDASEVNEGVEGSKVEVKGDELHDKKKGEERGCV